MQKRGAFVSAGRIIPLRGPHYRDHPLLHAVADRLTISGTHWLMPNVGTLAKDGNSYVFAAEG